MRLTPAPRRLLAAFLGVLATAAVLSGLLHGVEELVWDAAARSYAYQERPGADVVALAGLVLGAVLVVLARVVARGETQRAAGR